MNIEFNELVWLDHHHEVSLIELVELTGLSEEELQHLVDSGALVPTNPDETSLNFSGHCVISIRTLSRLKQDFELEPNAFALTLVFLERIRTLESKLQTFNPINSK
ncbi:MAG: chaperone modulator CbpM [Methylotenera sp.]|uniref:chaperone modulator CbpM n=1 Tax=Methylotenera sp. TaxID=2051956 RepID=UPI00248844F7|nr:chaperone modulator CbpM [Methylotenera sp.]MDI1310373.1 chaperone modulator CbpM [Methylotenera sp.]